MKTFPTSRPAFSLIEIIAVIAIALILIALAIPALRNMGGGPNVGMAATKLNSLLQLAASEARTKSTGVWVGFKDRTVGKDHQLVVVTVTSADGSPDFTGGVVPIGKPELFTGIGLSEAIPAFGGRATDVKQLAAATSDASFELPVAGENITFENTILRFGPSGEVTIPPDSHPVVEIGLQPMRGETKASEKNTAAIQIIGMTGMSRVYQP